MRIEQKKRLEEFLSVLAEAHTEIKKQLQKMHLQESGNCCGNGKFVEEYREEKWGIYDDSPDLNRAIAVCDAYYGDYSSLVQLCQNACKPAMIQNVMLSRKNGNVEESIYGGRK